MAISRVKMCRFAGKEGIQLELSYFVWNPINFRFELVRAYGRTLHYLTNRLWQLAQLSLL